MGIHTNNPVNPAQFFSALPRKGTIWINNGNITSSDFTDAELTAVLNSIVYDPNWTENPHIIGLRGLRGAVTTSAHGGQALTPAQVATILDHILNLLPQ